MNLVIALNILIFLLLTLIRHAASKPIEPPQIPTPLAKSSTLSSSSLSSSHIDQSPFALSTPSSSPLIKRITARLLTACPSSHPSLYRSTCAYSTFASASSPRAYTIHCYRALTGQAIIYFNLFSTGECSEDEICVDGIAGQGGVIAVPGPVASCVKMEDLIRYVGVAGKWIRQEGGQGEMQGGGSGTIASTLSALLPASISPTTSQKYSITALLTTPDNQTLLSASSFAIHPQRQAKTGANSMAWYDLPVISSRSHYLPLGAINNNITTTNLPAIIPNNGFNPRNALPPPPPPLPPPSNPNPNPKDTLPLPSNPQTCTTCAEVRLASIPPGTQRISVDVQLPAGVESGVVWMIGGGG